MFLDTLPQNEINRTDRIDGMDKNIPMVLLRLRNSFERYQLRNQGREHAQPVHILENLSTAGRIKQAQQFFTHPFAWDTRDQLISF